MQHRPPLDTGDILGARPPKADHPPGSLTAHAPCLSHLWSSSLAGDLAKLSGSNPARRRLQQQQQSPVRSGKAPKTWALEQGQGDPGNQQLDSPTGARVPRVSQPLRVEPPPEYNAPARAQRLQRGKQGVEQVLSSKLARRPLIGAPTAKARPEKMRDYAVLASACQRAGRSTRAAHLTFNQGVLYENMGEDSSALRCYKELLRSSLEAADAVGEALACNAIGVAVQLRGDEASLQEAIKYHQQHLAVADIPGALPPPSTPGKG